MLFLSSDSERFEDGLIQGNEVWANNSGPALFKWRYTPEATDTPLSAKIRCFFEENRFIDVITRAEGQNPVVQNTVRLGNRVKGYVDSNDPTIFGFEITAVSKSDPKEYRCTAAFSMQGGTGLPVDSKPLSLQVVGNIVRLLFCL